jgi:hypothetical protein
MSDYSVLGFILAGVTALSIAIHAILGFILG